MFIHEITLLMIFLFYFLLYSIFSIYIYDFFHLLCIRSLSSSQTTSRDAKPTQHIETTHPDNVNLKLAFHKAASFHPHYSTITPQTYHHPVQRFRSWSIITSTHTSTSAAKKYIQPYVQKVFARTKQNNLILNPA